MSSIPFSNPIGWAQFRLQGGWKNLLLTAGVYAFILIAAMFAIVHGVRESTSTVYQIFVGFFLGFQVLAVFLYGSFRVAGAVRGDVTSKVIESHRLMPMTPLAAIPGYLLGSTTQALALFGVNFVVGMVAVEGAGIAMRSWAFSNAVILGFSLFLWTMIVFFSFRMPGASGILIGGLVLMYMSQGILLVLVPGLHLLISPMIGPHTAFSMAAGLAFDPLFAIAGLFQLAIGLLYVRASAQRYQRDDAVGFGAIAGLLLLALWTGATAVGLTHEDSMGFWRRSSFGFGFDVPFIVSLTLVLLLAILPVSSAVRASETEAPGQGLRLPPMLVVVLAALIVAAMTYVQPLARTLPVIRSFIVAAVFLTTMRFVLGIARCRRWRPRITAIFWLVASWGIPLLGEILRSAASTDPKDHMGQIGMAWPPGELYQIWSHDPLVHSNGFAGLAAQCVVAILLAVAYYRAIPRKSNLSVVVERRSSHE